MKKHGVEPNARTYDFIIKFYLECDNLEVALIKLAEMNDAGHSPSLKVAQQLIDSAGEAGQVRLALDLADAYEETTVRRLDVEAWVKLLIYSAEQLFVRKSFLNYRVCINLIACLGGRRLTVLGKGSH